MAQLILGILLLLAPVASAALEIVHVGGEAPSFSLPDLFGRTISLDYLDGHPGVIVFWSASSPGSTELLEDFRAYQEKWGRDDLAILAVNADGGLPDESGLKAVRDFANHLGIQFPVLLDSGLAMREAYGVRDLPAAVVINARGRVTSILRGSTPALREELKQSLLLALDSGPVDGASPAVADRGGQDGSPLAAGETLAATCSIPRARSCTRISERDPSASDPAVMAVRLCICHGDADAAQLMLSGVRKQDLLRLDLRFALAHMMLIKGRTAEARQAFEVLRENYPQESWGEWGLGLVALADGDAEKALGYLRAARAGGWSIPEAETAVLKYLEKYWRSNKVAPREEQFLALFEELDSVRVCYRNLNHRG